MKCGRSAGAALKVVRSPRARPRAAGTQPLLTGFKITAADNSAMFAGGFLYSRKCDVDAKGQDANCVAMESAALVESTIRDNRAVAGHGDVNATAPARFEVTAGAGDAGKTRARALLVKRGRP